jgi:hypothetical protein
MDISSSVNPRIVVQGEVKELLHEPLYHFVTIHELPASAANEN